MTLPADAPPALAQVAQRFVQTSRGAVVCQLHRVFDVHGGFSRRLEDLVMNLVYDDGAIVRVHVVTYSIDGKAASDADVAAVEQSWAHPKPDETFAPPFDPRNFYAYQYHSDGPATIAFTSNVRDAGHGDGSFSYDARYDVVTYSYHPNVLPPHATSGEISDRRAEVLPEYWASIGETQEYEGTYGPFAAAGSITATYSNFRSFTDVSSALKSL